MIEYLKNILEPLLIEPQALEISEGEDSQGKILSVTVARQDMGRVIGKAGETVRSIQNLVYSVGLRKGERVGVIVNEPKR